MREKTYLPISIFIILFRTSFQVGRFFLNIVLKLKLSEILPIVVDNNRTFDKIFGNNSYIREYYDSKITNYFLSERYNQLKSYNCKISL